MKENEYGVLTEIATGTRAEFTQRAERLETAAKTTARIARLRQDAQQLRE